MERFDHSSPGRPASGSFPLACSKAAASEIGNDPSSGGYSKHAEIGWHVVPIRKGGTMLVLAATVAVAVILSGCSAVGLRVKLSGFTKTATVTYASCMPVGHAVVVSGDLVGEGSLTVHSGVSALIYDAKGAYIGDGEAPVLSVDPGQAVSFRFSAPVAGVPASCVISWGFGPTSSSRQAGGLPRRLAKTERLLAQRGSAGPHPQLAAVGSVAPLTRSRLHRRCTGTSRDAVCNPNVGAPRAQVGISPARGVPASGRRRPASARPRGRAPGAARPGTR